MCVERLRECVQEGTCTCEGTICTCNEGYEGNGIVCTAVNEAKKSGIVSSDSQSAGEGSVGTTIGAIIAVLLVIVLIAGGVFVVMHIRKNRTNKDTGDLQNTEVEMSSTRTPSIRVPEPASLAPGNIGDTHALQNTKKEMSSPRAASSIVPEPAGVTPALQNTEMKMSSPSSASSRVPGPAGLAPGNVAAPSEENRVVGNRMEAQQTLDI